MPVPLTGLPARPRLTPDEALDRAQALSDSLALRRSVRDFTSEPVPEAVIRTAIAAACCAPSGANKQPWFFVAVGDPALKRRIREAAEAEERAFYDGRAGATWLADLAPLGTDWRKPFLEVAPWLIVVFQQTYEQRPDGTRGKTYYVHESVGLATGFLLATLHEAGLATLTHTPSPMGFLRELLGRPVNERAVMIVVAGHAAPGARVPDLARKPFAAMAEIRVAPAT